MVDQSAAIDTARAFVKDCRDEGITFYRVLLFGSFVQNEVHQGSDIDLLLVSDQFTENIFENLKLYSKVNIRYPIIETHPYPRDDFITETLTVIQSSRVHRPW
jgi:predicted nucleotidyltransferase